MDPIYFASADEFRAWLDEHHAHATEMVVGFYKVHTGKPSMTWSDAVDQALCFGWIDGVGRRVDDERYTIRFTPRKPTSIWSKVNVAKVEALTKAGLMQPAGIAAYERRSAARTGTYSHEAETHELGPDYEARFRADEAAWAWWEGQPPSYRRAATHWVTSAKREETREKRLATLVEDSRAARRIKMLRRRD
ncbi:MAG TPA: YdeI/OmpD-associated family protein [Acidimicrobiales bacterium]